MPTYGNVKDTITYKEEMLQMTKIKNAANRQKMTNRQIVHTPYVRSFYRFCPCNKKRIG